MLQDLPGSLDPQAQQEPIQVSLGPQVRLVLLDPQAQRAQQV